MDAKYFGSRRCNDLEDAVTLNLAVTQIREREYGVGPATITVGNATIEAVALICRQANTKVLVGKRITLPGEHARQWLINHGLTRGEAEMLLESARRAPA